MNEDSRSQNKDVSILRETVVPLVNYILRFFRDDGETEEIIAFLLLLLLANRNNPPLPPQSASPVDQIACRFMAPLVGQCMD